MRYFEDIPVGLVRETGTHTMNQAEIVAFAREFDPQPFHLDEEAARHSIYGGLIASGWHTASVMMRLIVDGFVGDMASLGSPGFDNLRWLRPVRPGDTIHARSTCVESIPSRSKPIGVCKFHTEVFNQHSETVMTVLTIGMYRRRPSE